MSKKSRSVSITHLIILLEKSKRKPMKAAYIEAFAEKGNLIVADLPAPEPKEGEICISVRYAGVNPVDGKIAKGLFQSRMPHRFPLILGWDAAGTVASLGKGVSRFKEGDRVFAYCRKEIVQHGSWAEFVTVEAKHAALIPPRLSFDEAASIPLAALTAWQGLFEKLHLESKETVLIHGAAGGVGGFAIQLAKGKNGFVIATASAEKGSYVRDLGADEVIDYRTVSFVEAVRKIHPEGIDAVFDSVGKDVYRDSFKALKPHGRIVSILEQPDAELAKQHGVRAEYLFVYPDGGSLEAIGALYEKGALKLPKIETLDLAEASLALEKIRTGHTLGKIVLRVTP